MTALDESARNVIKIAHGAKFHFHHGFPHSLNKTPFLFLKPDKFTQGTVARANVKKGLLLAMGWKCFWYSKRVNRPRSKNWERPARVIPKKHNIQGYQTHSGHLVTAGNTGMPRILKDSPVQLLIVLFFFQKCIMCNNFGHVLSNKRRHCGGDFLDVRRQLVLFLGKSATDHVTIFTDAGGASSCRHSTPSLVSSNLKHASRPMCLRMFFDSRHWEIHFLPSL